MSSDQTMGNDSSKNKPSKKQPKHVPRVPSSSTHKPETESKEDDKSVTLQDTDCNGEPHFKCNACLRIVQILKYYHNWNQSRTNNTNTTTDPQYNTGMFEYISNTYNLTQLNDDHIHITECHDDELEDLYKYTLTQIGITDGCNIGVCTMIRRNNRSRNKASTDNQYRKSLYNGYDTSEEIMAQQIMDKIHSYILHSFDSLKLTEKEQEMIDEKQDQSEESDSECECETAALKDNALNEYKKIIDKKKFTMRDIATVRQRSFKFASTLHDHNGYNEIEEIKHEDSDSLESETDSDYSLERLQTKETELDSYSFGIRWYYWSYYKECPEIDDINSGKFGHFYIAPFYEDLKAEVTINPSNKLSVNCWNDVVSKGQSLIKTRKARMSKPNISSLDGTLHYQLLPGQSMSLSHIIAMLLYANFTELQKEFTETFRPNCEEEKICDTLQKRQVWFKRHSKFHFWTKFLRECVECYGNDLGDESENMQKNIHFYHGINRVLYFKKTVARFCAPLSVTPEIAVAQNFSSATGLILKIKGYGDYLRFFNVSWLSDYTAESERLFIGGHKRLTIESIINVSTAHNYLFYLKAINNLFDLIQGFENKYPFDGQIRKIFEKMVIYQEGVSKKQHSIESSESESEESEPLTAEILAKYALSIPEYVKKLFGNWCNYTHRLISLNIDRINNKRVKYLFVSEDNAWIRLERLCLLFVNLKFVVVKNGLNLHQKTFKKLIRFVSNEPLMKLTKLKEIIIIKPNENYLSIEEAQKLYQKEISKHGWKLKCGLSKVTAQKYIKIQRCRK